MIKLVKCNLAGLPMGEHNHACKYPDDLVAQARHMYDQGMTLKAISAELGPCFQTIHDYVTNRRRRPPVRVIARRIRPEQSAVNHQQAPKTPSFPSEEGYAAKTAATHTVRLTDIQ
jgi:hypothetical protein